MPDTHDPAALVRHAAEAGDWRLVELIVRMLQSSAARVVAQRACATLAVTLGLAGGTGIYYRG